MMITFELTLYKVLFFPVELVTKNRTIYKHAFVKDYTFFPNVKI